MPPPHAAARPPRRRNNAGGGGMLGKLKKKSPFFNYRAGLAIGSIILVAGILSVGLSAYSVTVYKEWGIIDYPSVGVWAGVIFYIPAGILGIAARSRSTCIIFLYMTWCIFAALVGLFMTGYEGVVAGVGSLVFACKSLLGPLFTVPVVKEVVNERLCENFGLEEAVMIHGVLAFIGIVEFVVSIIGSAFCCSGLCCGMSHIAPIDVNV